MKYHFSWRLGLLVIILLTAYFFWRYPIWQSRSTLPVRQNLEIRATNDATDNSDDAARRAINQDTN